MLVSDTRVAGPLFFVVKVDFLCVRSPPMVPETTLPENCCNKADFAHLELQEKLMFDQCLSFKEFGQLN